MPESSLDAAFDLVSPKVLGIVLINLLAGLIAGWWFACWRFSHGFAGSTATALEETRDLANKLSERLDGHVSRTRTIRRDLTRLELKSERELSHVRRALDRAVCKLDGELRDAACRLRRDAQQRHFQVSQVQQTTTTLVNSVHTNRAAVESLREDLRSHGAEEENPVVDLMGELEQLLRTLDQLVASANQSCTLLAKRAQSSDAPDTHERAAPATRLPAPPSSADASDPSNGQGSVRAEPPPPDLEFQRMRALTRHVADQTTNVKGEHRCEKRWNIAIPAVAVPVDDTQQPTGEPIPMVTRDISTSGISLIHAQPVPTKFLRVQLDAPILQSAEFIVRVVRTRTIGAYTEIAGEFVSRINANKQGEFSDPQPAGIAQA